MQCISSGFFNCRLSYVSYRFAVVCRNRAGYLLRNWSFVARLERGVSLTVWALLFVFGVTIGSNRELIANFGRFGWQAAVIACLGVAGSFAVVFVVRRYFFRKGGCDER